MNGRRQPLWVSPHQAAAEKMLPEAAVPVPETLREQTPQPFKHVLGYQHHAASILETRRFSNRKPA